MSTGNVTKQPPMVAPLERKNNNPIPNIPMAQEVYGHKPLRECWTAEAAQRGIYSRVIQFAPSGATFVSPRFYRGENTDLARRYNAIPPNGTKKRSQATHGPAMGS
ncbi:MAG: hypothetical protein ACYDHG_13610 [Desulfomonilaceae bacterium]